jgi:hypothetical protein
MKKTFLAITTALLLSSCNDAFYQVYNAEAPDMTEQGNSLIYENMDCKLIYNLWGENGNAGFTIQNKTDKDLFLVLSRTFFIKNGVAFDYFMNRERSNTEIVGTGASATIGGTTYGVANVFGYLYDNSKTLSYKASKNRGYSSTVTKKERPVICIPANSSKYIKEYLISDVVFKNCDKKKFFPSKESRPETFTKEDTPLLFKNIISYSYNEDGSNLNQIENVFWVSEIINYSKRKAFEKKNYKECEGDMAQTIKVFKMASPTKFYNRYNKKINSNPLNY